MKFSVEKATSVKKRSQKKLRDYMIEKENLHIEDLISYQEFLRLYNNYGKEFTKKQFAEIFLDIKDTDFNGFKEGTNRSILKKEEIDPAKIELMKLQLIRKLKLKKAEGKFYNEIEEIYNSIGTKLNIITFSEKVLEVLRDNLSRIKYDQTDRQKIFTKTDDIYFSERSEAEIEEYIKKTVAEKTEMLSNLKDNIAMDMNLHMGDKLKRDKFLELYHIYGEDGFSQFDFARHVLGMTESRAKKLIDGKISEAKVWGNEILGLDYLLKIREQTIFEENLHIKDQINYEKFKEIYKKHSGILSETDFASEILDIAKANIYGFKEGKGERVILTDVKIPEDFYEKAKQTIQETEDVYIDKPITYAEFKDFYERYGFITNEVEFAEQVFELAKKGFSNFQDGTIKTKRIFLKTKRLNQGKDTENYNPKQIEKLREIVIKENKLHIEDFITGEQFVKMYNKYGSGMSQKTFANKILDISEERMKDIVNDYEKRKGKSFAEGDEVKTGILRNEKVSDQEIDRIRKTVFESGEHYKGELIDYKEFKRLHNIYGEKLSERQFSEDILFMAGKNLSFMKNNIDIGGKRAIFSGFEFSDAYIANLKARVIKENLLYFEQRITSKFFEKIYKDASTIMSRPQFAQNILEIREDDYGHMFYRDSIKTCRILSASGSMENKKEFLKRRDNAIFEMLAQGLNIDEIYDKTNGIFDYGDIKELKIQYGFKFDGIKQMLQKGYNYVEIEKKLNISHNTFIVIMENLSRENKDSKEYEIEFIKAKLVDEKEKIAQTKLRGNNRIKDFEELEEKCMHIVDDFKETRNSKAIVLKYINACQEKYQENLSRIPVRTIDNLHNALKYVEYDVVDIRKCTFFTKACIANMEYKKANDFITFSMQNDLITLSDKKKLHVLRQSVNAAQRKSREVCSRELNKKERVIA